MSVNLVNPGDEEETLGYEDDEVLRLTQELAQATLDKEVY